MTTSAQSLISVFDQLPELEKKEVAAAILRRTVQLDLPPLSDEELVLSAEEVFLELDRRTAGNEKNTEVRMRVTGSLKCVRRFS